tara:strand:+ start:1936 stop:2241 length:306 start_codon:yes stop_codon:yes gene_type:complete
MDNNDISNNDISNNYDLVKRPSIYDRKNLINDTHEEIRILQSALDEAKYRLVNFQNDYNYYCLKNKDADDVKFMLETQNDDRSLFFYILDTISFGLLSKFC